MNPIEVLSLSFCSRKSRERIKQIRFHVDYAGITTKVSKCKAPLFQLRNLVGGRHLSIPFETAPRWARCDGRRFIGTIEGAEHYFRYRLIVSKDKNKLNYSDALMSTQEVFYTVISHTVGSK